MLELLQTLLDKIHHHLKLFESENVDPASAYRQLITCHVNIGRLVLNIDDEIKGQQDVLALFKAQIARIKFPKKELPKDILRTSNEFEKLFWAKYPNLETSIKDKNVKYKEKYLLSAFEFLKCALKELSSRITEIDPIFSELVLCCWQTINLFLS